MLKSIPIAIALLFHCLIAFINIPLFALSRWSGLTIIGITILILRFSMHTVGIICIVKRLKWGRTFNKFVFGYYMITSGFGLLSFNRKAKTMGLTETMFITETAIYVIIFIILTWLFMRFRSDPSVRTYFEGSILAPQETAHS